MVFDSSLAVACPLDLTSCLRASGQRPSLGVLLALPVDWASLRIEAARSVSSQQTEGIGTLWVVSAGCAEVDVRWKSWR